MEVVVMFVIFGVAAVAISSISKSKKKSKLQSIGAMLGGGSDDKSSAWGNALGTMATMSYVTHGSGSNAESWTQIDVQLPAKYPFAMNVRRHGWFDRGKIERGSMVDVNVGDHAFDEAFLIEAAPADVVRKLFDPYVRAALTALPRFQLQTLPNSSTLRLEVRGWVEEHVVHSAVTTLAAIVNGLRGAYSEAEAESQPVVSGSPFRQEIDDAPARMAAARREAEVSTVNLLQEERKRQSQVIGAIVVIAFVLFAILIMLG